jgi:hypothetical protein
LHSCPAASRTGELTAGNGQNFKLGDWNTGHDVAFFVGLTVHLLVRNASLYPATRRPHRKRKDGCLFSVGSRIGSFVKLDLGDIDELQSPGFAVVFNNLIVKQHRVDRVRVLLHQGDLLIVRAAPATDLDQQATQSHKELDAQTGGNIHRSTFARFEVADPTRWATATTSGAVAFLGHRGVHIPVDRIANKPDAAIREKEKRPTGVGAAEADKSSA